MGDCRSQSPRSCPAAWHFRRRNVNFVLKLLVRNLEIRSIFGNTLYDEQQSNKH